MGDNRIPRASAISHCNLAEEKTTYGHSPELEIAPAVHRELAERVQPIPVDRNALSVVVELEDDLQ